MKAIYNMSTKDSFLVQKWWDFEYALIAKVRYTHQNKWATSYLKMSYHPTNYGVFFLKSRFQGEPKNSNIQAFMRKNHAGFSISSITQPLPNDYEIRGLSNQHKVVIQLNRTSPPQLEILIDNVSHCRISSKGCYTKKITKKILNEVHSHKNILPKLVQKSHDEEAKKREEPVKTTPHNNQSFRKKQLQNKRKSLLSKIQKTKNTEVQQQKIDEAQSTIRALEAGKKLEEFSYIDKKLVSQKRTAGQNIDTLYKAIKKMQKSILNSKDQEKQYTQQLKKLNGDLGLISEKPLTNDIIEKIAQRHQLQNIKGKRPSKKSPKKSPDHHRLFEIEGVKIFVGKSASSNDEITKNTRPEFVWLHASGVTGSHVVIKEARKKTPKETLRKAAILALHYSKMSKDLQGEVCVTTKKNLKKTRGLPAGKWLIQQADYDYYKYSEKELKDILKHRIYE